jgi:hypothetical protein
MKSILSNFGFFIVQFAWGTIFATLPTEDNSFTASAWEMQEYVCDIAHSAYKTVDSILSLPPDEQTFDNTLKPWDQLISQLSRTFNTLNELVESQAPLASLAFRSLKDLSQLASDIHQNRVLCQTLLSSSEKALKDTSLNAFQHHLASCFVTNNFNTPLYIKGALSEKQRPDKRFTVLELDGLSFLENYEPGTSGDNYLSHADILCIHGVFGEDAAYQAYEALQKSYAHFIYVNSNSSPLRFPKEVSSGSLLIASKYSLKIEPLSAPHEFFGFTVENGISPLANFYISFLKASDYERVTAPYFSTTLVSFLNTPCGKLTTFTIEHSSENPFKLLEGSSLDYEIILCGGSIDVSATQDNDGNKSAQVSVSTSTPTENGGSVSASASGRASQDSCGNTNTEVKVTVSVNW